ncbi:hypothetical protein [Caballeronia novacaledonica]|uniref:hypothetical protein n=1 Tax=Caballeronia novacaledonica TaxID=1544861 RepID=UPI001FE87576|nr:hypothetical protein [Caballeronia novacaledonica]
MSLPERPIAFVLAASNHCTMIVNRNDVAVHNNFAYGVGHQILSTSSFDASEVSFVLRLLTLRRRYFGDGVFAIDGGANIGCAFDRMGSSNARLGQRAELRGAGNRVLRAGRQSRDQ